MPSSAKVIAFPIRARMEPSAWSRTDAVHFTRNSHARQIKLWLVLLLAPLLLVGSVVLFMAVVGVWLVWLAMIMVLVVGMIVFARRLFFWRRTKPARARA
jgi:hypothetical protein